MKKTIVLLMIMMMVFTATFADGYNNNDESLYLSSKIRENLKEVYDQLRFNDSFKNDVKKLKYVNEKLDKLLQIIADDEYNTSQLKLVRLDDVYVQGEAFYGNNASSQNRAQESAYKKAEEQMELIKSSLGDRFVAFDMDTPENIGATIYTQYVIKCSLRFKIDRSKEKVLDFSSMASGEVFYGNNASSLNRALDSLEKEIANTVDTYREIGGERFALSICDKPEKVKSQINTQYSAKINTFLIVKKNSLIDTSKKVITGERMYGNNASSVNRAYNSLKNAYERMVNRYKESKDIIYVDMGSYMNIGGNNYQHYQSESTIVRIVE